MTRSSLLLALVLASCTIPRQVPSGEPTDIRPALPLDICQHLQYCPPERFRSGPTLQPTTIVAEDSNLALREACAPLPSPIWGCTVVEVGRAVIHYDATLPADIQGEVLDHEMAHARGWSHPAPPLLPSR